MTVGRPYVLLLNFSAVQTLVSQTAARRPVKLNQWLVTWVPAMAREIHSDLSLIPPHFRS